MNVPVCKCEPLGLPHPLTALKGATCGCGTAGMFVDGKEVNALSGQWIDVEDPATGDIITKVASGDGRDVDTAIAAAQRTFASGVWSRSDPRDRAHVMNKAAAALALRVPEIAELESAQVC